MPSRLYNSNLTSIKIVFPKSLEEQKIILKKIDALKSDKKKNQYKLFLLYFLLTDTDFKENKDVIDMIFEDVNLPILKVSTYFKINFYLAFNC